MSCAICGETNSLHLEDCSGYSCYESALELTRYSCEKQICTSCMWDGCMECEKYQGGTFCPDCCIGTSVGSNSSCPLMD